MFSCARKYSEPEIQELKNWWEKQGSTRNREAGRLWCKRSPPGTLQLDGHLRCTSATLDIYASHFFNPCSTHKRQGADICPGSEPAPPPHISYHDLSSAPFGILRGLTSHKSPHTRRYVGHIELIASCKNSAHTLGITWGERTDWAKANNARKNDLTSSWVSLFVEQSNAKSRLVQVLWFADGGVFRVQPSLDTHI